MSDVSQFVSNWRLIGNVIAVLSGKSRARNELAAVVVAVRRLALPLFGVLRRGAARLGRWILWLRRVASRCLSDESSSSRDEEHSIAAALRCLVPEVDFRRRSSTARRVALCFARWQMMRLVSDQLASLADHLQQRRRLRLARQVRAAIFVAALCTKCDRRQRQTSISRHHARPWLRLQHS